MYTLADWVHISVKNCDCFSEIFGIGVSYCLYSVVESHVFDFHYFGIYTFECNFLKAPVEVLRASDVVMILYTNKVV